MRIISFHIFTIFILIKSISPILFQILRGEERCVVDEFYGQSTFVIKHKIYTEKTKNVVNILPYTSLNIRDAKSNKLIYGDRLTKVKDKTTKTVVSTGYYKICIFLDKNTPPYYKNDDIYVKLKITSENTEDVHVSQAVKMDDVSEVKQKADKIVELTKPVIAFQREQLENENLSAIETLKNTKFYKYLTFGQLVVTIIIGVVQVNNFRKFLKSLHVI